MIDKKEVMRRKGRQKERRNSNGWRGRTKGKRKKQEGEMK